jgi:hypothetical protein
MKLTRDDTHLYTIKPCQRRWIDTGLTCDNKQGLMGLYCPYLVGIFFDLDGNLLEVQKRPIPFVVEAIEKGRPPDLYDERIEQQLLSWQEDVGFQLGTIRVKKFFVLEGTGPRTLWQREGIGIEDYPAWHLEVLTNPDKYCEDDRGAVADGLSRWESEGQFVLWWGNDYWFDKTGECVAS